MSEGWLSACAAWERVAGMTGKGPIPGPATKNIRAHAAAGMIQATARMFIVMGEGQQKSIPNHTIPANFWDMSLEVEDWRQGRFVGVQRGSGWEVRCEALGVNFQQAEIEMIVLNAGKSVDPLSAPTGQDCTTGRRRKYDWEGALIGVIALANSPDGLPTGYGAQAKIERMLAGWFQKTHGVEPSSSELRLRARRIVNEVELFNRPAGKSAI